ncbi:MULTISPECIES: tetratricopeptide repeat protein [unclassified Lentimicrobium]|uniref:tetratricopeptide repeat protein n=1 Tax=unclassified Lentimicrobium TaxID=2677434 RepID=UPI0015532C8E|nr:MULTISPECIES: tetratricopeptide repeat protein [unclassified Lentimicrobium]NPD48086.1 tetratricopeptide repeat protein [Lentimicrobium sp. S6]NPD86941.1 tetratricopeptide repeat protein [Lentimicrobium sp. L6]
MTLLKPKYWLLLFLLFSFSSIYCQDAKEDKKAKMAMNTFLDAEKNKMLDNYPEAIKLYEKTLNIDENYDPAMYELGRILVLQQEYTEALFWVEKAYHTDGSNKWYALLLIDLYRNNYQIPEAIAVYEQLLENEPNNTDYLLSISGLYTAMEKYSKAIKAIESIEKIDGISEKTRLQMKNLYMQEGEFDKAAAAMIELSHAYPQEEKYCSMIAEMYMQQQKPDKALEWYDKVLEINPDNPYIQITLADYYAKKDDLSKAYEYLKEGYSNKNLDIDTKIQVLATYMNATNQQSILKERAYELIDILVTTHPDSYKSHAIYGDLLFSDSLYQKAAEEYEIVIKLDSTSFTVWNQLLYSLGMGDDHQKVADYSYRAMEQFPEQEFPYYVNALANFRLEDSKAAIATLEQGLYFVSNQGLAEQFYMLLGDAYHSEGDPKKAYENYDNCLRINPENSFVLNNYAYYLSLENKDLEKAKEMAAKAIEIDANENNLDTYGWILYLMEDYQGALKYISQSIEITKNPSAVVLEHLGDVYMAMGNSKEAKNYWKKAKKAGGDATILQEKIKQK